jgi:hypothetical protein
VSEYVRSTGTPQTKKRNGNFIVFNIAIKESFFFLVERSGTELKKKFGWRSLQDFGTL